MYDLFFTLSLSVLCLQMIDDHSLSLSPRSPSDSSTAATRLGLGRFIASTPPPTQLIRQKQRVIISDQAL